MVTKKRKAELLRQSLLKNPTHRWKKKRGSMSLLTRVDGNLYIDPDQKFRNIPDEEVVEL